MSEFPIDLYKSFRYRFESCYPDINRYEEYAAPLLRLMLAAPGPLPASLARKALGDDWPRWSARRAEVDRLILDMSDGLEFCHGMLRVWLQDVRAGAFRLNGYRARKQMAEILWADFRAHEHDPSGLSWRVPLVKWLPGWLELLALGGELARRHRDLGNFFVKELLEYDAAEYPLKKALEISGRTFGFDHADTAESMEAVARLERAQGHFGEAFKFLYRALRIKKYTPGIDDPYCIRIRQELAETYMAQGRYDEALGVIEGALEVAEHALGDGHPDIAEILRDVGLIYERLGRYDEAIQVFERVVALIEWEPGLEHPEMAVAIRHLARVYRAKGCYGEGLAALERAINCLVRWGKEVTEFVEDYKRLCIMVGVTGRLEARQQNLEL